MQRNRTVFLNSPFFLPTLLLMLVAPTLFGCQPPWASGFLFCGVCVLTILHLQSLNLIIEGLGRVSVLAFITIAWLGALVAYDFWAGTRAGRVPALSEMPFFQVLGFLGAYILGAACGSARAELRVMMRCTFWVAFLLAVLGFLSFQGIHLTERIAYFGRLSAFTNPNRFAVYLTICLTCGLSAVASDWKEALPDNASRESGRRIRTVVAFAAAVFVACCIVLTLSRLTLISIVLVTTMCGFGWSWLRRRQFSDLFAPPTTFYRRASRWGGQIVIVVAPVLAIGVCLALGQNALIDRTKKLALESEGRWYAWVRAWPLLWEHPIVGQGLGTFESRFTTVQPLDLPGRWRELHSDWLQLAFEAGWPAAGLVFALACVWGHSVWQAVKKDYESDNGWAALERALPAAGVLVALLCSLADFPLREPATAMLVFFIAGSACQNRTQINEEDTRRISGTIFNWFARIAFSLLLMCAAYFSGRNALAWSRTPWAGRLELPKYSFRDTKAWRAAWSTDPGDIELQYSLAAALYNSHSADSLLEARGLLKNAQEKQPHDYRLFWMAARIEEELGNADRAVELGEKGVLLAPNNPEFRDWMANVYLSQITPWISISVRDERLHAALEHFRKILPAVGAPKVIKELKNSGAMISEISLLWPGIDGESRLRRAEFFLEENRLDLLSEELASPVETKYASRYHLIKGTQFFKSERFEEAVEEWRLALESASELERANCGTWMTAHLPPLDRNLTEELVKATEPFLAELPDLNSALVWSLVRHKSWLIADSLLKKKAGQNPGLMAAYAEVALAMSDFNAADLRSQFVLRSSMDYWGKDWYKDFRRRLRSATDRR